MTGTCWTLETIVDPCPDGLYTRVEQVPAPAATTLFGENPRRAQMFLDRRIEKVAGRISREPRWGWDGASLGWPAEPSIDPSGMWEWPWSPNAQWWFGLSNPFAPSAPAPAPATPPAPAPYEPPSIQADTRSDLERYAGEQLFRARDTNLPPSQRAAAIDNYLDAQWQMAPVGPWERAATDFFRPRNFQPGIGGTSCFEQCVIAGLSGATLMRGRAPCGEIHHPISRPIYNELEQHPNLAGRYAPRDPRFTTQALDEAAHRGYQTWHRELDAEVGQWLRNPANANATPADFEAWLRWRYSRPDLRSRFPNGF